MKAALLALVVLVVAVACGGGSTAGSPSSSPSPSASPVQIGPLVLKATGCSWQGPAQAKAGEVSIQMVNQTQGGFQLDFWLLDKDHAYEELVAHIKEEQRRVAAHEPPLGHPTFASLIGSWSADAGQNRNAQASLSAGTYGFVCIPLSGQEPTGIYLAGPLKVA
jgi:hypothetical protein